MTATTAATCIQQLVLLPEVVFSAAQLVASSLQCNLATNCSTKWQTETAAGAVSMSDSTGKVMTCLHAGTVICAGQPALWAIGSRDSALDWQQQRSAVFSSQQLCLKTCAQQNTAAVGIPLLPPGPPRMYQPSTHCHATTRCTTLHQPPTCF